MDINSLVRVLIWVLEKYVVNERVIYSFLFSCILDQEFMQFILVLDSFGYKRCFIKRDLYDQNIII